MTPDLPGLRAALARFTMARGRTRDGRLFARSETAPVFDIEGDTEAEVERQITARVEAWARDDFGVPVTRRVYGVPGYPEPEALAA